MRSAIVILADGARADVFERLLQSGALPQIQQHIVERGSYRRASSTFTSTTIPAHVPFLTGQFAGTANVPGYRWFDRDAYKRGLPRGPWCLRSYNGPEAMNVDNDISTPADQCIFGMADGAVNIFGAITKGLPDGNNLGLKTKNKLWLKAHYLHDYVVADHAAGQVLLESLADDSPQRESEYRFLVVPGIDWNSHYIDCFGPETEAAYGRIDKIVGDLAARLIELGTYEQTLLAIVSDHGHCPVTEHFDLPVRMQDDLGMKVAYHSRKAWRRGATAIVGVSGNAMGHVYLRDPKSKDWRKRVPTELVDQSAPGLRDYLLEQPAIDLIATRATGGELLVQSRRGSATVKELAGGLLEYRVLTDDPFGYSRLPQTLPFEQALKLTFDSEYPDGLLQLCQIFRSPRCGDLVVSANPGFDLREKYEWPEHFSSHGALHNQHMHVPLAISAPLQACPVRTVDVFPMTLQWLGKKAPAGIDGISRLA